MSEEEIKVHAIGGSQIDGTLTRDARVSLGNITSQTGGTFTFTDQVASEVDDGLNTIANDLIAEYGGSSEIQIQADINNTNAHQQSIDIPFDFTVAALELDSLDLSTQQGAMTAIDKLKSTLTIVLEGRAKAGALHHKLILHGNASAVQAESSVALQKIQDANIADESVK